uniref:DNA-directed RNA polymerase subunit beta' n=1 Tax=Neochloris aquatica TaxID=3099 RepID=A0A140H9M5_9CHLO|nr:beta subunit of RNA polymerase [Neochloris aquatica]AMO00874.1 beta subunit of RNA polymerase [Neochloris aquatica]
MYFLLKNLKFLHFQEKNQIQGSVLTYPMKEFLKNPSEKNFTKKLEFKDSFFYTPCFFQSKKQIKNSKNKWFDWTTKQKIGSDSKEDLKTILSDHNLNKLSLKSNPIMKYSKLHEFKLVTINIASPRKIKDWAEKILPNGKRFGEVTNANTLHYKTFKPHKGGLFCERIFGPLKDFQCACGIYSKPTEIESKKILEHKQIKKNFCPNCDVEYTWSVIRRYQLGYIQLVSPVSHVWYLKANPSYLSLLLDFKKSFLESIIYCTASITLENLFKSTEMKLFDISPKNLYSIWQKLIQEEKLIGANNFVFSENNFIIPEKKIFQKILKIQTRLKTLHIFYQSRKNLNEKLKFSDQIFLSKEKLGSIKKEIINNWPLKNFPVFQTKQFLIQLKILKKSLNKNLNNKFTYRDFVFKYKLNYSYCLIDRTWILLSHIKKKPKTNLSKSQIFLSSLIPQLSPKSQFFFILPGVFGNKNTGLSKQGFEKGLQPCGPKNLQSEKYPLLVNSDAEIKKIFVFKLNSFFYIKKLKIYKELNNQIFLKNSFKFFFLAKNYLEFLQIKEKFFSKIIYNFNFYKLRNFNTDNFLIYKNKQKNNSQLLCKHKHRSANIICRQNFTLFVLFATTLFFKKILFQKSQNFSYINFIEFFILKKKNFSNLARIKLFENSLKEYICGFFIKQFKIKTKKLEKMFFSVFLKFKIKNSLSASNEFFSVTGLRLTNKMKKINSILISLKLNFLSCESKIRNPKNLNLSKKLLKFFYLSFKNDLIEKSENFLFEMLLEKQDFKLNSNFLDLISTMSQKNYLKVFKDFFELEIRKKHFFLQKQKAIKFKKFVSFSSSNYHELQQANVQIKRKNKLSFLQVKNSSKISSKSKIHRSDKFETSHNPVLDHFHPDLISKYIPKIYFLKKYLISKTKKQSDAFLKNFSNLNNAFQSGALEAKRSSLKKKEKLFKKFKLKNPLYTISYFHLWSRIKDWKSFIYYSFESPKLKDKYINYYENRNYGKENFSNSDFVSSVNSAIPLPRFHVSQCFPKQSFGSKHKHRSAKVHTFADTSFLPSTTWKRGNVETWKWKEGSGKKELETLAGAAIIKKLLTEFDSNELKKMVKQHQILIPIVNRSLRKLNKSLKKKVDFIKIQKLLQKRDHIIRRLKLLSKISNQNTSPHSMILSVLPVLPPDLRPILKLQNQIAASDLNRLYQRIIYRNERLKKFLKDPSTSQSFEIKYAQRLLQEAVDNLIENGKGTVKPETNSRGQALKSLSEILKGKQGRFRQYLLGKRVDYSGRSVIVVGPKLKLSECGLPLKIAIELFLPFLIKKILHYKLAKTVVGAKSLIYSNQKFTWNLLNEIMKNHPILLNRAPTLHKLGIQAFLPKLINGQAILLHPLVCPAFNADFDGDQMAVHVPITVEARTEAWSFLFSRNHLLSAATGEPIILPSQDMVLGCYYLTSENLSINLKGFYSKTNFNLFFKQTEKLFLQKFKPLIHFDYGLRIQKSFNNLLNKISIKKESQKIRRMCFYSWDSVLNAYQRKKIELQSIIWLKWDGQVEFAYESFSPIEIRLNSFGYCEQIQSKIYSICDLKGNTLSQYIRTTPGRILMNTIIKNCMRF